MPRSIDADRRRFLFVGAGALLWSLGAGRPAAAAPSPLVSEAEVVFHAVSTHQATGRHQAPVRRIRP
jgi:hypothetical protein